MRSFLYACACVLGLGCADDETTTTPELTCQTYATVTPGGSLATDVMPLFARSCALASSCHQGSAGQGMEGLGLGPNLTDSPAPQMVIDGILDQLLTVQSNNSPLPYVNPGKPAESWLQAKIEYDGVGLAKCSQCTECGNFMPDGSKPTGGFLRTERDVIAAWILDGAQNN